MAREGLRNERTNSGASDNATTKIGGSSSEGSRGESATDRTSQHEGSHTGTSKLPGAANEELKREVETLRSDMAKVREDLSRLREAGNEAAGGVLDSARDRLEEEASQLLGGLQSTPGGGRDMLHDVEHKVGEHPLTTILSSFGIGVLVGWILSRE